MMTLVSNPRAKPLAVVSFQDGVFVVNVLGADKGVICLTADTTAEAINMICKAFLEEKRRDKDEVSEL